MSAWSDYKCGAISYDDYRFACKLEEMQDEYEVDSDEEEVEEDG